MQCHSGSVENLQRETEHSTASLTLPRQSADVPPLNECPWARQGQPTIRGSEHSRYQDLFGGNLPFAERLAEWN